MPIRIANFMGRFGWEMQKKFPKLSSQSYLKAMFFLRRKSQKDYIEYFMRDPEHVPYPNVVNLETINRCNSNCAFCTANVHAEKRPYMYMTDEMFRKIIDELADWGYKGHLTMYGNNEPLLDKNIVERHRYAREKLPDCFIFMSTNGLLLNVEKLKELKPYMNQLIINNYCEDMKFRPGVQQVIDYVQANPEEFKDIDILVQMRYVKAVLTNRAGSAPNRQNEKEKVIKETCLMPYTDMWITPDGRLGYCCCDNFEVTELANLKDCTVAEGWNSQKYRAFRERVRRGRQYDALCKHCDFIDAGLRMHMVNEILKEDRKTGGKSREDLGSRIADTFAQKTK